MGVPLKLCVVMSTAILFIVACSVVPPVMWRVYYCDARAEEAADGCAACENHQGPTIQYCPCDTLWIGIDSYSNTLCIPAVLPPGQYCASNMTGLVMQVKRPTFNLGKCSVGPGFGFAIAGFFVSVSLILGGQYLLSLSDT